MLSDSWLHTLAALEQPLIHTCSISWLKKIQETGCNYVSIPNAQRKYKIKTKHTSQHYPDFKIFRALHQFVSSFLQNLFKVITLYHLY